MSTIVVTPPAAAARVAVSKPSHSVRPGSLTCTCVSTRPGETTRSPALNSAGAGRIFTVVVDDALDDAVLDVQRGRPLAVGKDHAVAAQDEHRVTARSLPRRPLEERPAAFAADERAVLDHQRGRATARCRSRRSPGALRTGCSRRSCAASSPTASSCDSDRTRRCRRRSRARSCPCAGTARRSSPARSTSARRTG